jgi:SAM-dependent methyltransferase
MDSNAEEYRSRLVNEENFYRESLVVHNLPDIYHYWSEKYLLPKLQAAGFTSIAALFADPLSAMCARRPGATARFLSVGAGNCDMEIDLAASLREAGHTNFVIDCLDLNSAMLQRGTDAAAERGLADHIAPLQADFNQWHAATEYDGVVANQALHHVMNLEGLFAEIKRSLRPDGCFVISDMIGRNGHLRWPEALTLIHEYWQKLPPSHRFNWQLKRYETMFEDFDCSLEGFEGIRSQDILPLLVEHFHFDRFVGYGNLIDPFVDRSFGHNFDIHDEWDRAFIDEIHARDELEIGRGSLTPTHMFAVVDLQPRDNPANVLASARRGPAVDAESAPVPFPDDRLGRVLAELETERRRLAGQLHDKSQEVQFLHDELVKRTEWAWGMEKKLNERSQWAVALDRQIEELTKRLTSEPPSGWIARLLGKK